jgi:hypothetical protein
MTYLESIVKVLLVGLVLGAGLPAVFAGGLVAYSNGAGGTEADGSGHAPNPALKYFGILLFVFVGWVILTAVLWITRATLIHHFGLDPFPFMPKK